MYIPDFSQGECRDLPKDFMYPERGDNVQMEAAKAICESCVIVEQCLDYALLTGERIGIWGATSGRERRTILKNRKNTPCSSDGLSV